MSNVADLIFTCSLSDEVSYWALERLFRFFTVGSARLLRVDRAVVGDKAMQAVVAISAINGWGIYEETFVTSMRAIHWEYPGEVRVFLHRESSDAGFIELLWQD
jgi:hypothetical protein